MLAVHLFRSHSYVAARGFSCSQPVPELLVPYKNLGINLSNIAPLVLLLEQSNHLFAGVRYISDTGLLYCMFTTQV